MSLGSSTNESRADLAQPFLIAKAMQFGAAVLQIHAAQRARMASAGGTVRVPEIARVIF